MSIDTIALVVVAGFLTGILAALFGVGGGLLLVPFMVLVLDESQHVAQGTSLLVIVPTAAAGMLSHARNRSFRSGTPRSSLRVDWSERTRAPRSRSASTETP